MFILIVYLLCTSFLHFIDESNQFQIMDFQPKKPTRIFCRGWSSLLIIIFSSEKDINVHCLGVGLNQQCHKISTVLHLTTLQFSISMNYYLHCFSINSKNLKMLKFFFNVLSFHSNNISINTDSTIHEFHSTLIIFSIEFNQRFKTSQLFFNL